MSRRLLVLGPALMVTLGLTFALWGTMPTAAQTSPITGPRLEQLSGDEFDKAFLLQMGIHQLRAVMIARPASTKALHQEVRDFGTRTIITNTAQYEQMRSWAKDWYDIEMADSATILEGLGGVPTPAEGRPRTVVDFDGGIADDLARLPPERLEPTFLNLMIAHHQSGIEMAVLAYYNAEHQELMDLANAIETSHTAEIERMKGWLTVWYGL